MIKSIAFTVYVVSDLARARRFYEDVLGLTPEGLSSENFQEYGVGGGTFAIGCLPENAPDFFKNRGSSIAFEVEDLDATHARMKELNVPILSGPSDYPGCRMLVITDPDNNVITLHQIKQ
ncbi:MAG TPA: VOC family protein [Oculatellaceae cyanobacterium]